MTYEYICTDCEHQWEASQSINDAPLKSCPSCKKKTARRQISGGTGFVLKGGGWYADGYGSKKPESSGDSKSTEAAPAKDATSNDSKDKAKDSKKAKPSDSKAEPTSKPTASSD